jgi:hypothetical protein
MDTFVRRIRRALSVSQAEFGRLIGRSHQSVQAYEKSGQVPEDVLARMRMLCAERMLVAQVEEIDDQLAVLVKGPDAPSTEWHVTKVFHPSGHVVHPGGGGKAPPILHSLKPGKFRPENIQMHQMLEDILNSGDPDATAAVVPNILLFHKWISRSSTKAKKSAGSPKE